MRDYNLQARPAAPSGSVQACPRQTRRPCPRPACPRCGEHRLVVEEAHPGVYRAWGASIRLHPPRRVARCTGPGCGFRAEGPQITAADIKLPGSMGGGETSLD